MGRIKVLEFTALIFVLANIYTGVQCNVVVKSPESLADIIANLQGNKGYIDYSISTFGYLDYQAQSNYALHYWPDEQGCEDPNTSFPELKN